MIGIASVQHSGTRFLRELFNPPVRNVHFGQNYLHQVEGYFIITPLRQLDRIIGSWVRRDMDLEHLHKCLGQMVEFPVNFYFPIDHEDRKEYLKQLNEILDLNLKTDWRPKGNQDKSARHPKVDVYWRDKIKEDYTEFFEQFYGRNS